MVKASQVDNNEYNSYYSNYILPLGETELILGLKQSLNNTISFFNSIPETKLDFAYKEGKWTIKTSTATYY